MKKQNIVAKNQKHKQTVVKSRVLYKRDRKPAKTTVQWLWPRMVPWIAGEGGNFSQEWQI